MEQTASSSSSLASVFDGLTVVDMTTTFMGPYCTLLLAQFGARVIKIEAPGGDVTRSIGDVANAGLGPIFVNCNRGKESIVLDLTDRADYAVLEQLVAGADVFTHNRPPGSIERLGIDYATLSKHNPRLIHCGMYGYGAEGPKAKMPAYDDVIQAVSGVAASQSVGGVPQFVRTPMTDKVTSLMAAFAIAGALYERSVSGVGQAIEVPMFETAAQFLLMEQQAGYIFDPPRGPAAYTRTQSPHRHPYQTTDGLVAVMPYTDAHWQRLFGLFGATKLLDDPRFATMKARSQNIDALYEWLGENVRAWPSEKLLAELKEIRIPCAAVGSVEELFTDDHLSVVDFFQHEDHPVLGSLRLPRNPVRFSRTSSPVLSPAPLLDEQGAQVRRNVSSAG